MPHPSSSPDSFPLLEVGWYEKLADAREAALGLAAKDIPYSIDRLGREWVIRVDSSHADIARAEIEAIDLERLQRKTPAPAQGLEKVRPLPLFVALWVLCGFFFGQQTLPAIWTEAGVAISQRIVGNGEWWRCITALTMHGDLPHLIANLMTGLLFAAFLQPLLGSGWTWVLILSSGAAGNLINAWGYRNAAHASLGASTAVFGALGILVGLELWSRWSHPDHRNRWALVVPLGAGLALLAYLGVEDENKRIDITAHLFGMVAGLPLGVLAGVLRLRQRTSQRVQVILSALVFTVIAVAWMLATGGFESKWQP